MATVYLKRLSGGKAPRENREEEHAAGIFLLQEGLFREYGMVLRKELIRRGDHGKPYLQGFPEIYFSISHCAGLAACAIGKEKIGVDVEKVRAWKERVAKRVLTPSELCKLEESSDRNEFFFRLWTLKESYAKMDGRGLGISFREISFQLPESGEIFCSVSGVTFQQTAWNGYLLTLCLAGKEAGHFYREDCLSESMVLLE